MSDMKHRLLARARRVEKVTIPELGADLYVRRMSGHERNLFQSSQLAVKKDDLVGLLPLQALLLSMTVCEEDGTLVFDSAEEVEKLDGLVLDALGAAAMALNGMTSESRDQIEKKA